jgi:hypothetical protein
MLLGFYPQFVPKIEDGSKDFTLRNTPKRMPKIGETLHMYTGSYAQKRTLITREHKLLHIQEVVIKITLIRNKEKPKLIKGWNVEVQVDGRLLSNVELFHFYVRDGFDCEADFVQYNTKKFKKDYYDDDIVMLHWTNAKY